MWIETLLPWQHLYHQPVTPCVGVWIETFRLKHFLEALCRHTLRGCVDWNIYQLITMCSLIVTPCVGVWIETSRWWLYRRYCYVTPCVGVWIETMPCICMTATARVTPCVGVWIETEETAQLEHLKQVTPCVGVWIETSNSVQTGWPISSHPAWVYMDWSIVHSLVKFMEEL